MDGRIFRIRDTNEIVRIKGVTAFGLMNRFWKGGDIKPFLDAVIGFDWMRIFLWTPEEFWHENSWDIPPDSIVHAFLDTAKQFGFNVELTLLTAKRDDQFHQDIVNHYFTEFNSHENLLIELVNEPDIHDKPDTTKLVIPPTSLLWTSGDYVNPEKHRGDYFVAHISGIDWPRRSHELMEYYDGGGPHHPSNPSHKMPVISDESTRPDQANFGALDYRAYFGACSLFGAGATFHFESGKFGKVPSIAEAQCMKEALVGLNTFPANAPGGSYRRIDEETLRTYVIGNHMVRIRPRTLIAPELGWNMIDSDGILWSS